MNNPTNDKTREPARESREKYEAPRVVEDAPLEHLSLACGKITGPSCAMGGGTKS